MGGVVETPPRRGGARRGGRGRGGRGRYQPVVELVRDDNNNDHRDPEVEDDDDDQEDEEEQEVRPAVVQPAGPILVPQGRRVRGVPAGERGELADRLDPEVPGPLIGPLPLAGTGWEDIDRLGAWECALNPFLSMSTVPGPVQTKWARVMATILRAILNAQDETSLTRALKWFLLAPQAFLRQAKRGSEAGRSYVAGRFNSAMEDDWGSVLRLLMVDREREEERKRRRKGARRKEKSETEKREDQRKAALSHLSKGEIGKAVSRLTSFGVASTEDPAVMAALRAKYVERGKDLPDTVLMGQAVDSLSGLKETLLNLPTGVSPGTGGLRGEFLACLAEVWDDNTMGLLEEFGMLYLNGHLPPWWYRVWGSVTTVPLFKTVERETVRPVGVRNPLIRTLHSRVIKENREAFTDYFEPQQLALSEAGGHKLVHQVRRAMEEHRDWVVAKVDVRNAHNEVWRSAIITSLEAQPTLQHLAWFAAVILAPSTGLETGGEQWGEQGEGETQGDPKASPFFASAIHPAVQRFDAELGAAGGIGRFGNDDGYGCGPPEVVYPTLARLEAALREECGLTLQRQKTEVFAWGDLPPGTPVELKRAGKVVDSVFQPGFDCYGIPLGTDAYVCQALRE